MKQCSKCKILKEKAHFYKCKSQKDELNHWCKICFKNLMSLKKNEKSIYDKNRYVTKSSEILRKNTDWKNRNKDRILKYNRDYIAIRNKHVRSATPKWLNADHISKMIEFYRNRPSGYHVDHIVPLRAKNVCGLHVPWNLQYLPAIENLKKGNKFNAVVAR